MIVTQAHVNWWRNRHTPSWAGKVQTKRQLLISNLGDRPSIHDLINLQGGIKVGNHECMNLVSLLILARRNLKALGSMLGYMQSIRIQATGARGVWIDRFIRRLERSR